MNRNSRHNSNSLNKNAQFFSFMNETFELFENYVKMNQKIIARFQVLKEVGKSFEIDFMSKQNGLDGDDFDYEESSYQKSNGHAGIKQAGFIDNNNMSDGYNDDMEHNNDGYYDEENHNGNFSNGDDVGFACNENNEESFQKNIENSNNYDDGEEPPYSDNENFFSPEDDSNVINDMEHFDGEENMNGFGTPNGKRSMNSNSNGTSSSKTGSYHNQLLNAHGKQFQYFCPDCGKGFMKTGELKSHARVHSDERPFPCNACSMSFKQLSHLKRHERIHTGEKPFACSLCDKSYTRSDRLKDHMKVHANESVGNRTRPRHNLTNYKADSINQSSHF